MDPAACARRIASAARIPCKAAKGSWAALGSEMTNANFDGRTPESGPRISQTDDSDRLQELMDAFIDGDGLSEDECDDIGNLGADGDELDELIDRLQDGAPTRMAMLVHRLAETLKAIRNVRPIAGSEGPIERIHEEFWRALADEALGTIGEAARRQLAEKRLIDEFRSHRKGGITLLCDAQSKLGVFRGFFGRGRADWERAYWKRALDESFGKKRWTGPQASPGKNQAEADSNLSP
jgi:hypothetical protein